MEGELCTLGSFTKNWKHSKWVENVDVTFPKQTREEATDYQSMIHFTLWMTCQETEDNLVRIERYFFNKHQGYIKRVVSLGGSKYTYGLTNWEGGLTQLVSISIAVDSH